MFVADTIASKITLNTDDWTGYSHVADGGRTHVTVSHTQGKRVRAKDLDSHGINEVHNNAMKGYWNDLRNFLLPIRGISKASLAALHA